MTTAPRLLPGPTDELVAHAVALRADAVRTPFESRQLIARLLGATHDPDTGRTTVGFWVPELAAARVLGDAVLEVFRPVDPIDLAAPRATARCERFHVPLVRDGDYAWGVVAGLVAGDRDRLGDLYWVVATDADGRQLIAGDLVANSIPWGSFAPAELYDMASLQRRRSDLDHFATAPQPPVPPTSILELHVPTATAEGTLGALARRYREIADRRRAGLELSPADQALVGYDAIQPLPVDPTIERPGAIPTFSVSDVTDTGGDAGIDASSDLVDVLLRHPDNLNWGYDNIVAASSATNPSLLGSRRPDELVELAEALHAMPDRPIMLIYDLVYGHADGQAQQVLPSRFFKGPNMYGLDLNHQDPTVRAILLEMQRRRIDTGCDGLRVDGAQDFKFYDPRTGTVEHDDDYLRSMSDLEQDIGGHRRRVWMIFEDGRPWPESGWETSSTYRDVIDDQPDVYQWGPLIFAHNTPMLDGFWVDKWWRVEEVARHGGHWISGCANHDTVRRGTQVDPDDPERPINRRLGDDLPAILRRAYDHPAMTLVTYGLLPGVPMDFLQATLRAPWGFMRTTDDLYGVKVMAEEHGFVDWQLTDAEYADARSFPRTKRYGFAAREHLVDFLHRLALAVVDTQYDLDAIASQVAARAEAPPGLPPGADGLHQLSHDYMADVHDLCNVEGHLVRLVPEHVRFGAAMRDLRRELRWLGDDFRSADTIERRDGEQTLYVGHRVDPTGSVTVDVIANMAGATWSGPVDTGGPGRIVVSPGATVTDGTATLPDGTAVLIVR